MYIFKSPVWGAYMSGNEMGGGVEYILPIFYPSID